MGVLGQGPDVLVEVQDEAGSVWVRPRLNFTGAGVTAADNPAQDRVDVTIPAGGVTDHGALTGLLDDDHTIYALLAGRAGGQTLSGGTAASETLTLNSTSHATKGGVQIAAGSNFRTVDGFVGIASAPVANNYLTIAPVTPTNVGTIFINIASGNVALSANNLGLTGLNAGMIASPTAGITGIAVTGLNFFATCSGAGDKALVTSIQARGLVGGSGAITIMRQFHARANSTAFFTGILTDALGIDIENQGVAGTTNAYGLRVADITAGANRYLAWLGGSVPNLRVDATAPAANLSQVWIAVNNGAAVQRQIEIDAANSGGAGYRNLRVLN